MKALLATGFEASPTLAVCLQSLLRTPVPSLKASCEERVGLSPNDEPAASLELLECGPTKVLLPWYCVVVKAHSS